MTIISGLSLIKKIVLQITFTFNTNINNMPSTDLHSGGEHNNDNSRNHFYTLV